MAALELTVVGERGDVFTFRAGNERQRAHAAHVVDGAKGECAAADGGRSGAHALCSQGSGYEGCEVGGDGMGHN